MLICAILQNYSYNTENLNYSFSWEGRIRVQKIIFNLQILPQFYVFLKKWVKMIKKIHPVMKIPLHHQDKHKSNCITAIITLKKVRWKKKKHLIKLPNKTFEGFFYILEWNRSDTVNEWSNFWRLKQTTEKYSNLTCSCHNTTG